MSRFSRSKICWRIESTNSVICYIYSPVRGDHVISARDTRRLFQWCRHNSLLSRLISPNPDVVWYRPVEIIIECRCDYWGQHRICQSYAVGRRDRCYYQLVDDFIETTVSNISALSLTPVLCGWNDRRTRSHYAGLGIGTSSWTCRSDARCLSVNSRLACVRTSWVEDASEIASCC